MIYVTRLQRLIYKQKSALNLLTSFALETLIKYYYDNRQENTDWVVLPVANFDAYFGSTSFSKKRLTELVKSGAIERENSYNVSRYRLNEVFNAYLNG